MSTYSDREYLELLRYANELLGEHAKVKADRDELLAALREYFHAAEDNMKACNDIITGQTENVNEHARSRWIQAGKTEIGRAHV